MKYIKSYESKKDKQNLKTQIKDLLVKIAEFKGIDARTYNDNDNGRLKMIINIPDDVNLPTEFNNKISKIKLYNLHYYQPLNDDVNNWWKVQIVCVSPKKRMNPFEKSIEDALNSKHMEILLEYLKNTYPEAYQMTKYNL